MCINDQDGSLCEKYFTLGKLLKYKLIRLFGKKTKICTYFLEKKINAMAKICVLGYIFIESKF
jgi:hypothetical protein